MVCTASRDALPIPVAAPDSEFVEGEVEVGGLKLAPVRSNLHGQRCCVGGVCRDHQFKYFLPWITSEIMLSSCNLHPVSRAGIVKVLLQSPDLAVRCRACRVDLAPVTLTVRPRHTVEPIGPRPVPRSEAVPRTGKVVYQHPVVHASPRRRAPIRDQHPVVVDVLSHDGSLIRDVVELVLHRPPDLLRPCSPVVQVEAVLRGIEDSQRGLHNRVRSNAAVLPVHRPVVEVAPDPPVQESKGLLSQDQKFPSGHVGETLHPVPGHVLGDVEEVVHRPCLGQAEVAEVHDALLVGIHAPACHEHVRLPPEQEVLAVGGRACRRSGQGPCIQHVPFLQARAL